MRSFIGALREYRSRHHASRNKDKGEQQRRKTPYATENRRTLHASLPNLWTIYRNMR